MTLANSGYAAKLREISHRNSLSRAHIKVLGAQQPFRNDPYGADLVTWNLVITASV
jgi:hypothetical protein